MKIAYIVNHLGQTGVNHVVLDLIKQMQHHGHDCRLFYFEDNRLPFLVQRKRLRLRRGR